MGDLTINFRRHICGRDDFRVPCVCFFCFLYFGGSKDALQCPKVMETRGRKLRRPKVKTTRKKTKPRGRVGRSRGHLTVNPVLVPSHLYLDQHGSHACHALPLTPLLSLKYNNRLTDNWRRVNRKPNHLAIGRRSKKTADLV